MNTDLAGLLLGVVMGICFICYLARQWPASVKVAINRCPRLLCLGKIEAITDWKEEEPANVEGLLSGGIWHSIIRCKKCGCVWSVDSSYSYNTLTEGYKIELTRLK